MLETTTRAIRKGANAILGTAKKAVTSTARYDRSTYVSQDQQNKSLIQKADAILSNRPNILNESDYKDPEFQTVVNAQALRSNKARK